MKVQFNRNTGAITLLDKEAAVYQNSAMIPQVVVDVQLNSGETVWVTFGTKNIVSGQFEPDSRFVPFAMMPRAIEDGMEYYKHIPKDIMAEPGSWALSFGIRIPYDDTHYKHLPSTIFEFVVNDSLASIDFETLPETNYDEIMLKLGDQEADIGGLDTRLTTAESDISALDGRMSTAEGDIDGLEVRMTAAEGNKQDKSDPALGGLGGDNVVQAILEAKGIAEAAAQDAGEAVEDAEAARIAAETAAGAVADKASLSQVDGKIAEHDEDEGAHGGVLTDIADKYVKPATGIPASDLADGVQSALDKADSALQTESDPTVPAWAKADNKPEYTAAEIAGLESITNLVNYYKKSETYTQTEVNNLISAIPKLTITVVEELPTVGDATKIYVIGNKEYLWLEDEERYEQFGDLSVDLSDYYTKSQVDTALEDKVEKEEGKGLSTEDYTTTEKTKLFNIEAGAQVNVKPDWNASAGAAAEILNKPTIPPEQVNADWNASSGKGQILNKPAIPDAQIQSDWNQSNTGAKDYIKNKPTIPSPYTLPTASDTVLGGVKVGENLTIDNGVLSAPSGGWPLTIKEGF